MKNNTYLTTLKNRQATEGWSDREMGRQLGVGETTWYRIKRGDRGMGIEVLTKAMHRFPEYNANALLFLSENAPNRKHSAPNGRAA